MLNVNGLSRMSGRFETVGNQTVIAPIKRTQCIALVYLHEMFFEGESDVKSARGKFVLEKAATSDHKVGLFTKELHPAQFNHALDLIRIGCKVEKKNVETQAMASPPKSPIPDRPSPDMLRKVAVSISAHRRRWGKSSSNQET